MPLERRCIVAMAKQKVPISSIGFIFAVVGLVSGQEELTPPYFNLAVGRPIEATSTCGVGVTEPELFCKLTGANPVEDDEKEPLEVIDDQLCDRCDPTDPTKVHSPEFAVDGTETWWQSPPLSRGVKYNEVNITIHLEQEFHVAYVRIKMGDSPRPGVFALERSTDHGKTWQPWQFFADTLEQCGEFFGRFGYSDRDDSVVCTTEYSNIVQLEGGEIDVSLLNNRPSSNKFSDSLSLQNWTKATDIRLRLLRTKTLPEHLMAVAAQDPTVTRRYYYSIQNIEIGGRCICNGHATECNRIDSVGKTRMVCKCQHNTCGQQCEMCCPGFVQKLWRPASLDATNTCEPCQCNGHSKQCRYDPEVDRNRSSVDTHGRYEGGGVCINCLHKTIGINCEQCRPGYFRPSNTPINSIRPCQRCDKCGYTRSTGDCMDGTGQCICKPQYSGANCDSDVGLLQEPQINGYMFGGNGYVILAKDGFNPAKNSLVKFSFKTVANEGLMLLMGMPGNDFLSLELRDGQVVYQYELGSGRATISSIQRYNDGKWHKVTANRLHQDGIVKIDSYTVNSARSPGNFKHLDIDTYIYFGGFKGTHIYSNASVTQNGFEGCIKDIQLGGTERNISDHIEAKDILTGCPEASASSLSLSNRKEVVRNIVKRSARGCRRFCLEIWKFRSFGCFLPRCTPDSWQNPTVREDGQNDVRPTVVPQGPQINGCMFGGNGYVILAKDRFNPAKTSLVKFSFKTLANEGLMFLMGIPGSDFLSLEIRDGKVIYQYELGSGQATMASTQRYNDDKWHVVTANRLNQDGILKIDSSTVSSAQSPGNIKDLDINTYIYFGGFNGTHTYSNGSVTQKGFEGCIKDIQLGTTKRNISEYIEAKDILSGCPETSAFTPSSSGRKEVAKNVVERNVTPVQSRQSTYNDVSWHDLTVTKDGKHDASQEPQINGYMFGGNGYVILAKDRFNPAKTSLVKFSFKTFANEGLMFLMGIPGSDFLSLEIRDGKVIYQYELGSGQAAMASTQRYNDDKWHVVTANRLNQDGILKIDSSTVSSAQSPGNIKDLDINTYIYFGGFKGTHTYSHGSVTQKGFQGCIKDIQLGSTNRNISDYIEAEDILAGCPEKFTVAD